MLTVKPDIARIIDSSDSPGLLGDLENQPVPADQGLRTEKAAAGAAAEKKDYQADKQYHPATR